MSIATTITLPASRLARRMEQPLALAASTNGERVARFVFALAGEMAAEQAEGELELDWHRLLSIAALQNATLEVHNHFKDANAPPVPLQYRRQLAFNALNVQHRMLRLEQRLYESLAVLHDAGISVTLLKGSALGITMYGSLVKRPMNDLDLLVEPVDAARARQLMLQTRWAADSTLPSDESYVGHHHLAPLIDTTGTGLRLELHTSLLPSCHPFHLPLDEISRAAPMVPVGATSARVLSPVHHAVYLAIHWAWSHELTTGAWNAFRDLGTLLRRGVVDWDSFTDTARAWRAGTCAYWTLRLGDRLAGLPVPPAVLRALRPPLPEVILSRLGRHFEQHLLRQDVECPSVRLAQRLWCLAICPDASGHGGSRPWLVSPELRRSRSTSLTGGGTVSRFRRVFKAAAYLAAII